MNAEEINRFFFKFYKLELEINSFNPFLRISKPTKYIMRKYRGNKLSVFIYTTALFKFTLPFIIGYRLLANTFYNFARYVIYRKPVKEVSETDVVFLSHLTVRNLSSLDDTFFGFLPNVVKKSGKNIGIIYTNQIRKRFKSRIKEIEISNDFVISKYLQLNQLIRFYVCALKSVKYSLSEAKKHKEFDNQTKFLIVKACLSFLKIETMMNFHLIEEVKNALLRYKPSYIFLTFEGHIYENSIYLSSVKNTHIRRVFMCQSSPIVSNQFGFFDFIKNSDTKLTILVQGPNYYKLITEINKSVDVITIGKENESLDSDKSIVENNFKKMLLVPDGDKSSIKYFLDLTIHLYKGISQDISISLHPDTSIGIRNRRRLNDLKQRGIIKQALSNLSLNDLKNYEFLVYSSSSIAVKSLFWGNKLIYSSDSDYDINPLGIIPESTISTVYVDNLRFDVSGYPRTEYYNFCSELNYGSLLALIKIQ